MTAILDRLRAALLDLNTRSNGKRRPKAFYLSPSDWTEFQATTDGAAVCTSFGNNPRVWRDDAAFGGIPVRQSKSLKSRLYDHTSVGRVVVSIGG